MKKRIKYLISSILLLFGVSAFAQFNTLTRITEKSKTDFTIVKNDNKDENKAKEKPQKKKHNFFNITTKSDLKKEIDSLKMLILKNSLAKNEQNKLNYQKQEDSLFKIMKIIALKLNTNFKNDNNTSVSNEVENANTDGLKIDMPLNSLHITSPFGYRMHPIFGVSKFHNGIDLKADYQNVYAVVDGVVTKAGWDEKGGGNYIKINHYNRFETEYLHLSQIYYKVGDEVKAGDIIAKSGDTGNSTGPHLHFSVKEYGKFINPKDFLNQLAIANNLIAQKL